jgi:monoamine oxidase
MRRPNQHDKIAVLGAGAAGIHLAVCLRDRGFRDITIYEAADNIGGKCSSGDFYGVPVDIGAMMIPNRTAALNFLRRFSVDLVEADLTFYDASSRTIIGKTMQKLAAFALKGIELSRLNQVIRKYSVPDPLLDKNDSRWEDLSLPFAMLLRREKLPISLIYLASSMYPYGYGTLDLMPASYGIEVCRVWLECLPDQKWFFVRNGYQRALEKIAKASELRIETNTPIVSLKYDGEQVVCTFGSSAVKSFDFVINSVPHKIEWSPSSALFRDVKDHD